MKAMILVLLLVITTAVVTIAVVTLTNEPATNCSTNAYGQTRCYTDSEQQAIDRFNEEFGR